MRKDMVKTEWICDDCGMKFNSRSARLYHRNHTCKPEGKIVTDEPEEKTEVNIEQQEPDIKENKKTFEKETGNNIPDTTFNGGDIKKDEPLADPAIPWIVMIPIIAVILIMTGILIFRDKIFEFFKGKPPQGKTPVST
jgi:hypothetical protein